MEILGRRFGFGNVCYVDPIGLGGGLALWWTNEIQLVVLRKLVSFVHASIRETYMRWDFSRAPKEEDMPAVWEELINFRNTRASPWMCMADFNAYLWAEGKIRFFPPTQGKWNYYMG